MESYYSREELKKIGFKSIEENVLISRKASIIYMPEKISIGSNVRIDDFCVLTGNIILGNHIHISAFTGLFSSKAKIVMEDYTNLSSKITIHSTSDDYSGEYMTNPMVPDEYTNVIGKDIIIKNIV